MRIVESWLSGDISDDEITFLISGYSFVRLDRNRHGGGILIYIRSSLFSMLLFLVLLI